MNQWDSERWAEAENRERERKQRADLLAGAEQREQGTLSQAYANLHRMQKEARDSVRLTIARAIYPWVGDEVPSIGVAAANKDAALRAADNVIAKLKEAGYDIRE